MSRVVKYNPMAIRKAALTYDGIAHNGWIQEDDQGEKYFVYPGIEPIYAAVRSAMVAVGVPAEFKTPFPVQFGAQVKMLTPSLNQDSLIPTFSGPLAGVSMKVISNLVDVAGAPGAAALEQALEAVGDGAPTAEAAAAPNPAPPGALARVTRTHLARALVALGAAPNLDAAFTRWLGQRGRAYVPAGWPPLAEVTAAIVAAGGAPVLAHPLRYTLSSGQRRRLAQEFKAAGGAALEVVVGGHAAAQVEAATGLALRTGLAGSIGSDFHDPAFPWNLPGRLAKLPEAVAPVWTRWAAVQEALGV
jgi:predicted metal-dependent phosphoesterase TrpH